MIRPKLSCHHLDSDPSPTEQIHHSCLSNNSPATPTRAQADLKPKFLQFVDDLASNFESPETRDAIEGVIGAFLPTLVQNCLENVAAMERGPVAECLLE